MLLLLLACPPTADSDSSGSTGTPVVETEPQDSEEEPPIWTGEAQARVLDPEGNPVEGAFVLLGGWTSERWVSTDAEGLAKVRVPDLTTQRRHSVHSSAPRSSMSVFSDSRRSSSSSAQAPESPCRRA